MSEPVEKFLQMIVAGITAGLTFFGGKHLLQFITNWRKTDNEKLHISSTSATSTIQVTSKELQDWITIGSEARKRIGQLEHCIYKLLPIVEKIDAPETHKVVREVQEIIAGK
jgi:hypothetical protein